MAAEARMAGNFPEHEKNDDDDATWQKTNKALNPAYENWCEVSAVSALRASGDAGRLGLREFPGSWFPPFGKRAYQLAFRAGLEGSRRWFVRSFCRFNCKSFTQTLLAKQIFHCAELKDSADFIAKNFGMSKMEKPQKSTVNLRNSSRFDAIDGPAALIALPVGSGFDAGNSRWTFETRLIHEEWSVMFGVGRSDVSDRTPLSRLVGPVPEKGVFNSPLFPALS